MQKPTLVIMAAGMGSRFGVTYQEDLPGVVAAIEAMKASGLYPDELWR